MFYSILGWLALLFLISACGAGGGTGMGFHPPEAVNHSVPQTEMPQTEMPQTEMPLDTLDDPPAIQITRQRVDINAYGTWLESIIAPYGLEVQVYSHSEVGDDVGIQLVHTRGATSILDRSSHAQLAGATYGGVIAGHKKSTYGRYSGTFSAVFGCCRGSGSTRYSFIDWEFESVPIPEGIQTVFQDGSLPYAIARECAPGPGCTTTARVLFYPSGVIGGVFDTVNFLGAFAGERP